MDSRQDLPSPSSASKSASDRAPAPRESHCLIVPETSGQPASEPSPRQRSPSLLRSIQFSKRSLRVPSQRVATGTGQIGALDRESNYRASRRHRSYRFRGRHRCPVVDKVWKLSTDSSGRGGGWRPVSREFQSHGMGNRIECGFWDHWVEGVVRVSNGFGVNS